MTAWPTAAEWSVVALSLRVSVLAVLLTLPFAYGLAWLLARRRFPGRILLDAAVHLPLVLPPVVTGWVLLLLFGRTGPLGAWLERTFGLVLVFRWTGAARTLGATPWRAFRTITLPLSLPGVAAGTMLGFARSLGEFGATITFASNIPGQTRTLPLAIYTDLQVPGAESAVTRLAIVSVLLSVAALLASELLVRRSHGRRAHVL
jgi:molybdate transport system permease protein